MTLEALTPLAAALPLDHIAATRRAELAVFLSRALRGDNAPLLALINLQGEGQPPDVKALLAKLYPILTQNGTHILDVPPKLRGDGDTEAAETLENLLAQAQELTEEPPEPIKATPAAAPHSFAVGDRVRAGDRGNIGEVVSLSDTGAAVHFISPSGQEATVFLPFAELSPLNGAAGGRVARLYSLDDIEAMQPPEWTIRGILPAHSLAVLYGASGGGKTFVTLGMALSVGSGLPWLGRDVKAGGVVYAAGEGIVGLARRLAAWRHGFGDLDPLRDGPARKRVYFAEVPNLMDMSSVDGFVALVQAAGIQPAVVVVDTLARALVGGDENSAKDMGIAVAHADRLRVELGAAVLLVHHSGKDKGQGARGSSALQAAVDVSMCLDGPKDRLELKNEKQKDAEPFDSIPLKLEVVTLGQDAEGKPVSSCVVVQRTAIDLAAEKALEIGCILKALARPDFLDGATRSELMEATGLKKQAFHDAVNPALAAGQVVRLRGNKGYVLPRGEKV